MVEWVTSLINSLGYVGIAALMYIETLFPPIPSEVVMPFAGFAASQGDLTLLGVILAGTIGSFGGAFTLYALAKLLREEHIEALIKKYGRKVGISQTDFHKAQRWFDKNSYVAVFLCRILPGARSWISIPAGIRRMKLSSFLVLSFLGTAVWSSILGVGGYLLGEQYSRLASNVTLLGTVVTVAMGLIVGAFLIRRLLVTWMTSRKKLQE